MPSAQLKKYLDKQNIKYVTVNHSPAYTAQEVAASAHVPGRDFAKTVVVKIDGKLAMVVQAAQEKVNFEAVKKASASKEVELATESEFKDRFPECEIGAMPPFGPLYEMDVFITNDMTQEKEISFNAGSHSELIRMNYSDFKRLVNPKVL